MSCKKSFVDARKWLALPGYVLFFMMLAFPIVEELLYVKAGLFVLLLVIIVIRILRRGRLALHRDVALWTLFFAAVGLLFVIEGIGNEAIGWPKAAQLYILWPVIYTLLITGMTSWRVFIGLQRVLVLATLFIELYGLSYVLVQIGVLPEFMFVPIFDQGEAIGFHSGYLGFSLYSLNSLPFVIPFTMAALFTYAQGDTNPPFSRMWLWVSLYLGLALILVSGRRGLMMVVLLTFLFILFFRSFQPAREKQVSRKFFISLVVSVNLAVFALAYYWSTVYDFSLASVLDLFRSGFDFGSSGGDLGTYVRGEQYFALVSGWTENPLLGAGHGASLPSYTRSLDSPWSYELYYVALLFQVGLLGFLTYAAGIVWIYWMGVRIIREGGLVGQTMLPILVGFCGMLSVNATNPILPRFDGLWAMFFPIAIINFWLLERKKKFTLTSNKGNLSICKTVSPLP